MKTFCVFLSGLQRAERAAAEADHPRQEDPPGALSPVWPLRAALRRVRPHHRVVPRPGGLETHHPAGLPAAAGAAPLTPGAGQGGGGVGQGWGQSGMGRG